MLKKIARARHLSHLSRRLLNTPLAIEENAGRIVLSAISDRIGVAPMAFAEEGDIVEADPDNRGYEVVEGVAIVPVVGELCHRGGYLDAMSGLTSYTSIIGSVKRAIDDATVRAVMLDFDSPGGEIAGLFDAVDALKAMRGQKPIWAFSNERCFSAAYALASAADKIIVSRTSGVGSIGVVAFHKDISKQASMEGVKITPIYAGNLKVDGNPYEALSDDAKGRIQYEIDTAYDLFVSTVATNRDLDERDVRGTEAGVFTGIDAIEEGLADKVSSFGSALHHLARNHSSNMFNSDNFDEDENMPKAISDEEEKAKRARARRARARKAEENREDIETLDDDDLTAEGGEDGDDDILGLDEDDLDVEGDENDEDDLTAESGEDDDDDILGLDEDDLDAEDEDEDEPVARKSKRRAKKAEDEDDEDDIFSRTAARRASRRTASKGGVSNGRAAAEIVRVCTKGGCPELAEKLLRRGASVADAHRAVKSAAKINGLIAMAAKHDPRLSNPKIASKVARAAGGSIHAAREILLNRLAAMDENSIVNSHHAPGPSIVGGKSLDGDADAIYARRLEALKKSK